MLAAIFAVLALFTYSLRLWCAFSIPKLLVLSAGLVPLALAVRGGAMVDTRRAITGAGLIALGVALICAAFSSDPYQALIGQHNRYALGVLGLVIAFFYHVAAASSPQPERGLKLIALAGAVLGLHALAQWQGLFPGLTEQITGHRAISTIGAPTDLGMILALILPIALCESPVYGVAVGLGLLASCARGAWIAGAVGILFTQSRRTIAIALGCLAAGVLASSAVSTLPRGRSDAGRIATWKIGAAALKDHPLLGIGPDSFELAFRKHKTPAFVVAADSGVQIQSDAHNDVLQVLVTCGLLGLLAYAVLVTAALRAVRGPALGALAALFVNAKVNPVPLEGLVLAGVICGLGSTRFSWPCELRLGVKRVVLASSLAIFGVSSWLAVADYYACPEDFVSIKTATKINPFSIEYKARLVNAAVEEINATKNPALRLAIANEIGAQAAQAIRLRPNVSASWNIAGVHEEIARQLGLRGDPRRYLRETLELDPLHEQMRVLAVEAR